MDDDESLARGLLPLAERLVTAFERYVELYELDLNLQERRETRIAWVARAREQRTRAKEPGDDP
jgi:hypothetical protein